MTTRDNNVEEMCADLRQVLAETRNLDRRDFIAALGRTAAGAALMTAFAGMAPRRAQAADPVTIMSFGGTYKTAMVEAFCKPFTAKTGAAVQYQAPNNFAKEKHSGKRWMTMGSPARSFACRRIFLRSKPKDIRCQVWARLTCAAATAHFPFTPTTQ